MTAARSRVRTDDFAELVTVPGVRPRVGGGGGGRGHRGGQRSVDRGNIGVGGVGAQRRGHHSRRCVCTVDR